jgi:hypothetical protein
MVTAHLKKSWLVWELLFQKTYNDFHHIIKTNSEHGEKWLSVFRLFLPMDPFLVCKGPHVTLKVSSGYWREDGLGSSPAGSAQGTVSPGGGINQ